MRKIHTHAEITDVLKVIQGGMTIKEASQLSGIPSKTIYHWTRGKHLTMYGKPVPQNIPKTSTTTQPTEITLDDVIGALTRHKATETQLRSDLNILTAKYNKLVLELQELQSKLNTKL